MCHSSSSAQRHTNIQFVSIKLKDQTKRSRNVKSKHEKNADLTLIRRTGSVSQATLTTSCFNNWKINEHRKMLCSFSSSSFPLFNPSLYAPPSHHPFSPPSFTSSFLLLFPFMSELPPSFFQLLIPHFLVLLHVPTICTLPFHSCKEIKKTPIYSFSSLFPSFIPPSLSPFSPQLAFLHLTLVSSSLH